MWWGKPGRAKTSQDKPLDKPLQGPAKHPPPACRVRASMHYFCTYTPKGLNPAGKTFIFGTLLVRRWEESYRMEFQVLVYNQMRVCIISYPISSQIDSPHRVYCSSLYTLYSNTSLVNGHYMRNSIYTSYSYFLWHKTESTPRDCSDLHFC